MPRTGPPAPRWLRGARRRRRGLLGAALVVALAACGGGEPRAVSLAELALAAEDYDGEVVETVGVVRAFTEAEDDAVQDHFAVEDADHNRVELVPHAAVEPHVDDEVRVVGTFAFSTETGRRLEVDEIEPTDRPADLAP
jgi:hypothetical protein